MTDMTRKTAYYNLLQFPGVRGAGWSFAHPTVWEPLQYTTSQLTYFTSLRLANKYGRSHHTNNTTELTGSQCSASVMMRWLEVLNQSTPETSRSVEVTCSTSQAKCWAANASVGSFSVCVDYISCDAYRELCQLTVAGSVLYCDTTVWSLPNQHCVHIVNVSSSSLPVIDTVREGCQCGRWRHSFLLL